MSLVTLWHSRSPREKSLVSAGLVVLGIMLAVALVWLPLERMRVRLQGELPQLRASVAALQRDADEVKRLRSLPATVPANPSPLAMVMSANAWSREMPGVQLSVPDEKHVKVAAADVSFTALLDWIATARAAHGLHVENARIDALPATGRVRVELTLARS
jgi:type II secretory pathway component PulM